MYQMTIFDIPQTELETTPIEKAAEIIGESLGLYFKWNNYLERYETKVKGYTIDFHYSRYTTLDDNHGKLFIACGIGNNMGGSGCGRDSIEETISTLRTWMKNRGLKVLE